MTPSRLKHNKLCRPMFENGVNLRLHATEEHPDKFNVFTLTAATGGNITTDATFNLSGCRQMVTIV